MKWKEKYCFGWDRFNFLVSCSEACFKQLTSTDMQQTLWIDHISESQWVCNSPGPLLRKCNKERQSFRWILIVLLHCYLVSLDKPRLSDGDAAADGHTGHWSDQTTAAPLDMMTELPEVVVADQSKPKPKTSYCSFCVKKHVLFKSEVGI